MADLIVRNIGQLLTLAGPEGPRRGAAMRELALVEGGAVAARDGRVLAAGPESDVLAAARTGPDTVVVDAAGGVVTPGLVDPHTHAVFAATREDEFAMRVEGKSYEEIAEAGGGIRSSVRKLRSADQDSLLANGRRTLDRMLEFGTTTVEVKSGYGLSLESELKMLRVISELSDTHTVDAVPTFLGAHEFPDEWRDDRDGYVDHLIDDMIPAVAAREAGQFLRRLLRGGRVHGRAIAARTRLPPASTAWSPSFTPTSCTRSVRPSWRPNSTLRRRTIWSARRTRVSPRWLRRESSPFFCPGRLCLSAALSSRARER